MINRIIETFTKPRMEITAIDQFIQSLTLIALGVLIVVIYLVIETFIKNK